MSYTRNGIVRQRSQRCTQCGTDSPKGASFRKHKHRTYCNPCYHKQPGHKTWLLDCKRLGCPVQPHTARVTAPKTKAKRGAFPCAIHGSKDGIFLHRKGRRVHRCYICLCLAQDRREEARENRKHRAKTVKLLLFLNERRAAEKLVETWGYNSAWLKRQEEVSRPQGVRVRSRGVSRNL